MDLAFLSLLPRESVALVLGIFGLLVGSFLNVVVYRLPKMMERQWIAECTDMLAEQDGAAATTNAVPAVSAAAPAAHAAPAAQAAERFDLVLPASRCSSCGHVITWYENIPLLSYLVLRGKCAACKTSFGLRYPAVELASGLLFAFCAWRWGATWTTLIWCGFCAALLALALIDWDTTLLPDSINMPLLWAGLIAAALQLNPLTNLPQAFWGAVAGYLSLWLVYWAFKLVTGKDGMGQGDFKLFAALGAWFGWTALVPIILMSSVIGVLVGLALKFRSNLRPGGYIPFGPFLACAGFTALIFGPQAILRTVGL